LLGNKGYKGLQGRIGKRFFKGYHPLLLCNGAREDVKPSVASKEFPWKGILKEIIDGTRLWDCE